MKFLQQHTSDSRRLNEQITTRADFCRESAQLTERQSIQNPRHIHVEDFFPFVTSRSASVGV
jgi:hypothetical protein